MGRRKLTLDHDALLQMRKEGKSIKEISKDLNVSTATLSRRIAELKYEEGILTKYRQLQGLRLTELEFGILESITPEKIENASLLDLAKCFHVLSKVEAAIKSEESFKIKGLVGYLMELEKQRIGGKQL
jgi:DNA-binding Lrp family transcriptional regulator